MISQVVTEQQIIPVPLRRARWRTWAARSTIRAGRGDHLARLLPQALAIQVYRALLESAAGFQAAQMTAMDSATRNAGDMIERLTLNYNRARQANITKELIEIISGAEAV